MSDDDEIQEDLMRWGGDPDSCPACRESLTGMCRFHADLERMSECRAEQDRENGATK